MDRSIVFLRRSEDATNRCSPKLTGNAVRGRFGGLARSREVERHAALISNVNGEARRRRALDRPDVRTRVLLPHPRLGKICPRRAANKRAPIGWPSRSRLSDGRRLVSPIWSTRRPIPAKHLSESTRTVAVFGHDSQVTRDLGIKL
jgi:hypothetical protein